ncbi:MAG: CAP domain-containing protein [Oscillospiraceae bacterium]|nr:CAP domain-containing protein [Oscillospiraceae bacterium]
MKTLKLLLTISLVIVNLCTMNIAIKATTLDFITYQNDVGYIPSNVVDGYNPNEEGFGFFKNRINVSPIQMITNDDGTYTICVVPKDDDENIYIYEYDEDNTFVKNIIIKKALPKFGAYTKDSEGNYYVFFGLNIEAKSDRITKNMALVKYNGDGEKTAECFFNAPSDGGLGVKNPLLYGCKMKISKDNLLIYFGCNTYEGKDKRTHDASYAALFDLKTFTNITKNTCINTLYTPNSYDRSVLPLEYGFVVVDKVSSYPRSFKISEYSGHSLKSTDTFAFKGNIDDKNTYSELGGIVKTTDGFMIAGTYENNSEDDFKSSPRNVFVQKISDDLSLKQTPVYITDYTDRTIENAANLKIVQVEIDKNILLWELRGEDGSYKGTYMAIINDHGELQGSMQKLNDCRLNMYDDLSYNFNKNKISWAINQDNSIVIYELSLDSGVVKDRLNEMKLDRSSLILRLHDSDMINLLMSEEEASNKIITFKSDDESIAVVDEYGKVTALGTGSTDILVTIEDYSKIVSCKCTVNVINSNVDFEKKVIELCNIERRSRNIPPLIEDIELATLARLKSQNMIDDNYFGHNSPTYGDVLTMMINSNIKFIIAAENIAEGQKTPEEVVKSWMGSDLHRANILNKNFTNIGVGTAMDKNGIIIWTQEFTKPNP